MLVNPPLVSPLAVSPILGPLASFSIIPSPYSYSIPDFDSFCWPNTPSFSLILVQFLDNTNIQRSIFLTSSSSISWSFSLLLLSHIFCLPAEIEPTLSSSREKNMRSRKARRAK